MPCYTAWNEFLDPDTPEYLQAREHVRARLKAVEHIVDYYYAAFGQPMTDLPNGVSVDPFRQPRSTKETSIREMICHHFACHGIDFCTLYDVCSLLDVDDSRERAYSAVILPCATLLRSEGTKYRHS